MKVVDYNERLDALRLRIIEDIKLTITKLFKNHPDLANEICFADVKSIKSNPIYQPMNFNTTCFDDVCVKGNELKFTYSSELLDLRVGGGGELTTDEALRLLNAVEFLTEDDLDFE